MIESLYRITDRDRAPWDAETLLIMAIVRENMQYKATDKDCEQPYTEELETEALEAQNINVVSSFFNRFKNQKIEND